LSTFLLKTTFLKKSFYSHGKLLITGEYLVLDGVQAFALPTKKGQWLEIIENDSSTILWNSMDEKGNCWYTSTLEIKETTIVAIETEESIKNPITESLLQILNAAKKLNPQFLLQKKGYTITTKLEFDSQWGLGSSSTLIHNISQWASVNPYALLNDSFGGSGYDIACAKYNSPIFYKRNGNNPVVKETNFNPDYKNELFFIYLNQKQSSKEAIKHYQSLPLKDFDNAAAKINEITQAIVKATDISTFETLIDQHEEIISIIIATETIKSKLFSDYHKSIKSLGGWGGDFILATGSLKDMEYFKNRGFNTIIPYAEMIL